MADSPFIGSFFFLKQIKKQDVPFKKPVMFHENCRFIIRGFPEICLKSHFCSLSGQKTTKNTMSKPLRFVKIVVLFLVVFPEIRMKSHLLLFFWSKKTRCTWNKNRYVF